MMVPAETSSKRPLTQLNHEIDEAETEAMRLEKERAADVKDARRAARRLRYYRLAHWLRRPAASFELWPMTVMLFGPLTVGVLALIAVHLPFGSYPLAFFAFLLGTVAGVGLFASLIYYPADTFLPAAIAEAEAQSRLANARLEEKLGRIADVKQRLQQLVDERRDQIASGKLQRAALLQRNWKAMRDAEWEDFLVEVCRTLGATVERTGKSGDQGVDLVVEFGPKRIAVQAKGYYHAVNSKAVQEAVAGMAHYGCNACAAITNSRFTSGAKELAASNRCTLIGESEFPDFVLGKIEL
ncbi:MAG: restriction endonuclease [Planctomycetes bacterium]|nr:restriction endonuclease [Planctomycetota bacterium]